MGPAEFLDPDCCTEGCTVANIREIFDSELEAACTSVAVHQTRRGIAPPLLMAFHGGGVGGEAASSLKSAISCIFPPRTLRYSTLMRVAFRVEVAS